MSTLLFDGWEFLAGFVVLLFAILVATSKDGKLPQRPYERVHGGAPGASFERAVERPSTASLSRGTR